MHTHTKLGIHTSNNTMHKYSNNLVRGQGHRDPKTVRDTPPSQDTSLHKIWDSCLKECRRYAPDMKRDEWTL